MLGVALAAVRIDVALLEAQQADAVELLAHPEDAVLVLSEAAGDGAPTDLVVVVGEPLVLQQERLLAIEARGVGIQFMDAHVTVTDVDLVLVLVDEHGERVLTGCVAHII